MSYKFYSNRTCEYCPCHEGVGEFNCLFFYCPLYLLGAQCGGSFRILENGAKDCSGCIEPHERENYEKIIAKLQQVVFDGRNSEEN